MEKIGERNKNGGTKIGGDRTSAKRSVEQKLVGTVGHWVTGTPSASAKRSVEQKLVSGTKMAEQKLVGGNKKKVSRTKIGGHCQPLGDGDPKCKCKKVSRTKIGGAEQKRQNKN